MDRIDDVLSSVHKSVQLIESNTKASTNITNKVHELIRLTEVENNCDKHSSGQHNAESNIISNCDPVQSRYSNPHKQASAPVCSVVDTSATTADIFTDGPLKQLTGLFMVYKAYKAYNVVNRVHLSLHLSRVKCLRPRYLQSFSRFVLQDGEARPT